MQLPLSLYLLVHLCNAFDIVPHFLHHFGGSQDADTSAQAAEPSIKLGADLNIGVDGKMLFVFWNHGNIFAETVNHHIRQMVGKPYLYLLDFTGEHGEHPQGTL